MTWLGVLRSTLLVATVGSALMQASWATPAMGSGSGQDGRTSRTLERIRARGFVRCGSPRRPGLAAIDAEREWRGLEVELCRAVATAVFGANGRYAYADYGSDKAYAAVRDGTDDLFFLSFAEMAEHGLVDTVLPGPIVFFMSHDIMVARDSPAKTPADLAGNTMCFYTGTPANASLDAFYEGHDLPLIRYPFQEYGEMYDTFLVQRCKGVVDEATSLAEHRSDGGPNRLSTRILPQHLRSFPILAATPLREDAAWAAIVGWTIRTVMAADRPETTFAPGGLRAMLVEGTGLGLAPDWQKTVVANVGSYVRIFARTLGEDSPYKLEPGLNALSEQGGALVVPTD